MTLNDEHYASALREQASDLTAHQLRVMLAIIIKHSEPANPSNLWLHFANHLSDDCGYAIRQKFPEGTPSVAVTYNLRLSRLYTILQGMAVPFPKNFLPQIDQHLLQGLEDLTSYSETEKYKRDELALKYSEALEMMNHEQNVFTVQAKLLNL